MAATVPGYESVAINAVFAPPKTPRALIEKLNRDMVRVLSRPDIKEKFFNAGVEAVGTTPEQFTTIIKAEIVRWGKVIKEAGIPDDS